MLTKIALVISQYQLQGSYSGFSYTELLSHTRLPKSTLSRLLANLVAAGFLEKDKQGKFVLGNLIINSATNVLSNNLIDITSEVMGNLSRETGLAGYISVLSGHSVIVTRSYSGHRLQQQLVSPVGCRVCAAKTAVGRSILSRMDKAVVLGVLGEYYSEYDSFQLAAQIKMVNSKSCIRAEGESVAGVGAMATNVRHPMTGDVIGLCLSYPLDQLDRDVLINAEQSLLAVAKQIGIQVKDKYWIE
ncbi:IclR family transcriptional regulator domain-containing protein [Vibrio sinensis]|nr:helix-turn-helix domain-containing protein [Vibrio sinensis]